jgi:hypothetical protein
MSSPKAARMACACTVRGVACEHVVSVRRTAAGTVCLMSDGRQVPVSRRRRAEVLARFGDGAQYRVSGPSKAVADADLH